MTITPEDQRVRVVTKVAEIGGGNWEAAEPFYENSRKKIGLRCVHCGKTRLITPAHLMRTATKIIEPCACVEEAVYKRPKAVADDTLLPITEESCKFNGGVECLGRTGCHRCGWNPKVSEARLKAARKALGITEAQTF